MYCKKLLGVLLLTIILVLGCSALAEGQDLSKVQFAADKVGYDRMGIADDGLSKYLAFADTPSYSSSTGVLKVKIDDANTDWEGILSHGGGAPYITLGLAVKNPDTSKYTMARDFSGGVYDVVSERGSSAEAEAYLREYVLREILREVEDFHQIVEENWWNSMDIDLELGMIEARDYWRNGHEIGEIIKDQSLLEPRGTGADRYYGAYLGWYSMKDMYWFYVDDCGADGEKFLENAGSKVKFEYFWANITHNQDEAFYVPLRFATKYSLAPSADPDIQAYEGIRFDQTTFDDDEITFIVDFDKLSSKDNGEGEGDYDDEPGEEDFSQGEIDVYVAVRVPEQLKGTANEVAVYDREGNLTEIFDLDDEGIAMLGVKYFPGEFQVHEDSFTLVWQKYSWDEEEGDVHVPLDYGQFYVHVVPEDLRPWPGYVKNNNDYGLMWTPVPANRVSIKDSESEDTPTYADITYDQTTGILNAGFKADASISGEIGNVVVEVAPAVDEKTGETYKYYRTNRSGGNRIMGMMMDEVEQNDMAIRFPAFEEDMVAKAAPMTVRDNALLRMVKAGPVDVYLQNEPVWEYGGSVNVIYWYDSPDAPADQPKKIEYICETFDELSIVVENPCVEKEEDIEEPVKHVTAVGKHCKGWKLIIRYDLQRGHNAIHYDLHLENETGAYHKLDEPLVFYMPYPSGTNGFSHEYELRHYFDDYAYDESVTIECTPYGIRFVVDSLSPFTLEWNEPGSNDGGEGDKIPAPPTGDTTPVMLWTLLLAAALCGMLIFRRRQRAE